MFPLRNRTQRAAVRQSLVQKLARPYGPAAAGARAFREGLSPTDCPHPLDTPKWHHWIAGWRSQFDRRFV